MTFPAACPEIPVADLAAAAAYYRDRLGFTLDWVADDVGLAQVSQGASRFFLTNPAHRQAWNWGNAAPILLWINLDSRDEVNALQARWKAAGAQVSDPASQPYKLHEFFARDLDGNVLRVFYDFAWEERKDGA